MDETQGRASAEDEVVNSTNATRQTESEMQSGHLSSQPGWLTNLLARRPFGQSANAPNRGAPWDDGHAANRGSDALILSILDEAARNQMPMRLFDPDVSGPSQVATSSGFPSALSTETVLQPPASGRDSSEALVLRILDNAASGGPPIGLFHQTASAISPMGTQRSFEQDEEPGTPSVAAVIGGAGIGGNMPTVPKRPTAVAPKANRTSPNAMLARSLPLA